MFRIILSLFLLFFFAYSQGDVLTYLWSLLLERPVEPYPWLSAVVLTLVLMLLANWGARKLSCAGQPSFPAYVFVSWIAVALVSLPFATWIGQSGLVLTAVIIGLWGEWWMKRLDRMWGDKRSLWQNFFPPVLQLLVLGLYMGVGAAATDYEHYELRTAECLRMGERQQAYQIGEISLSSSPRLFSMRCYLMAVTGPQELGKHLFQQPVPLKGGSENLLFPNDEKQRLIFPLDSLYDKLGAKRQKGECAIDYFRRCAYLEKENGLLTGKISRLSADYYLSGLLLDRKLDLFAREIQVFYPSEIQHSELPHYFAQALVFYRRSRMHPIVFYQDAAVETNLKDYAEMEKSLKEPAVRYNMLRRSYGESYWWWYEYAK